MPRLSVWFIRTALAHLLSGFTVGALILWQKGVPYAPEVWRLLAIHVEFVLVGWTIQFACGIAFWILPRWDSARGDVRPAWLAYGLLNVGVLLVIIGAAWPLAPVAEPVGRVCEALAALAFARHAWPRVKALGK